MASRPSGAKGHREAHVELLPAVTGGVMRRSRLSPDDCSKPTSNASSCYGCSSALTRNSTTERRDLGSTHGDPPLPLMRATLTRDTPEPAEQHPQWVSATSASSPPRLACAEPSPSRSRSTCFLALHRLTPHLDGLLALASRLDSEGGHGRLRLYGMRAAIHNFHRWSAPCQPPEGHLAHVVGDRRRAISVRALPV
jgi:hypothetical protein